MSDEFALIPGISFAQNYEDVRLWKAVGHLRDHIWVDVGAGHPVDLSVTRLFHQRGWNGINIEPGPNFDALRLDRPNDVNVAVAITDHEGEVEFNVAWPHPDLSSIDVRKLRADPVQVKGWEVIRRPATTLAKVLERHSAGAPIAFLKIDVEGAEREVLIGNDWERFRPLVVVAESIEPGTHEPSYGPWEPILFDAGYEFAVDDGINRFYFRSDRPELRERLAAPVSVLDGFFQRPVVLDGTVDFDAHLSRAVVERDRALKETEVRLVAAGAEIDRLRAELTAVRSSWSFRIGGRVVRALRPFRPLLPLARRILRLVRWQRRRRLTRPEAVRARAALMLEPGRPLGPFAPVPSDGGVDPEEACRRRLLARRRHGPRLLQADEWDEVVALGSLDGALFELVRLAAVPEVVARNPVVGTRHALVIDARAIDVNPCGTRNHARSILGVVLDAVPDDVCVLTMGAIADRGDAAMERIDGEWNGDESVVGAFLQLAPFIHPMDDAQIRMVSSPDIRSVGVFLDAIMGVDPDQFLRAPKQFFHYQFGLECLAHLDRAMTLSAATDAEAIALGLDPDRLVRTGAVPRPPVLVGGAVGDLGLPFDRWLVVVGSGLVHKNLPVGVAGALASAARRRHDMGVVVVADVNPPQVEELQAAARDFGLPPGRLVVRTLVDDAELDALVRGAEVVVVPSRHEGYSLPVVEALERDVPVVVSDIAAHREFFGNGPWMFDVDDPEAVVAAIRWVERTGRDRALARQRRALAQRSDPDHFDRTIRSTTSWLCEGLAARGSRADVPWAALAEGSSAIGTAVVERNVGIDRPLSLSKVCEVEDFATPRLRAVMREVFSHELGRFGPSFPDGAEWRKYWEVAMAVLTFEETGLLDRGSRFLGVGAGNEPTVFHLTRRAARVLATDLYRSEGWEESADTSMLTDPGRHWPFAWEPTRLEVRHMDALQLDLADDSFDGVFSSSSIEHFGDRADVARSLDEIHRVLRPGGVLSISTEFRIAGEPPGFPGVELFEADEIVDLFVGDRGWSLVEPFDPSVSAATMATAAPFIEVARDQEAQVARLGGLWTHLVRYERYPHIVLEHEGWVFTSVHLALRKDG